MSIIHDRFVNNELLQFISRPQYDSSCSMSSLTAVINYLFSDQIGVKTTKQWTQDIGIGSPEANMNPGNQTVMKWFDLVCKHCGLKGSCGFFIRDEDVKNWEDNPKVVTKLKEAVNSKDQTLIYHLSNHYNIVAGYFENSTDPDEAYNAKAKLE